jgi:hypothetical protein
MDKFATTALQDSQCIVATEARCAKIRFHLGAERSFTATEIQPTHNWPSPCLRLIRYPVFIKHKPLRIIPSSSADVPPKF